MIFDDDFKQLTAGAGIRTQNPDSDLDSDPEESVKSGFISDSKCETAPRIEIPVKKRIYDRSREEKWSSEYGNPGSDYVIESDLVTPKIEIVKEKAKPIIVCVENDFDTLDLLKIFLQRDYDYQPFSGPKNAIFYLNSHVPALVLVSCKINTMKATTFMEIVRTGVGNENTKFVYTGTKEELAEVEWELVPEYVIGSLRTPVARGELQKILDLI